jgi:hypothetical protein
MEYNGSMTQKHRSRLDRLFPRLLARDYWPGARDAWDPAWQPRGRWWMRARRRGGDLMTRKAEMWRRRLAKPGRAA